MAKDTISLKVQTQNGIKFLRASENPESHWATLEICREDGSLFSLSFGATGLSLWTMDSAGNWTNQWYIDTTST